MATALLRSSIARFDGSSFGRIFRNQFLEKVCVALQATCSSHHAFFHRADFHTRNILCACGPGTERYADGKNQRLPDHNLVPERSCEAATPGRLRPTSASTRFVNWGDLSASVESQEHAPAEIQKTLPDHQLYGYLGCSAGTLSRRDTQSAWNLAATVRPTIGPSRHFKISPLAGPQTHALLAPGVNLVPILSKVPLGPRLGPSCYRVTADHRENISSR